MFKRTASACLSLCIHVRSTLLRLWKSCAQNEASDLLTKKTMRETLETPDGWRAIYCITYLEPQRPLFLKANPSKTRPFPIKTGVIWVLGTYSSCPRISSCSPSSECAHHQRLHIFRQDPAEIDEMLPITWLSTPFKYISQHGNLPQVGMKIKHIWNHHLDVHWFTVDCIKGLI